MILRENMVPICIPVSIKKTFGCMCMGGGGTLYAVCLII